MYIGRPIGLQFYTVDVGQHHARFTNLAFLTTKYIETSKSVSHRCKRKCKISGCSSETRAELCI